MSVDLPPPVPSASHAPPAGSARFVLSGPSRTWKFIKWIIFAPAILIAIAILWTSLLSPFVEKTMWSQQGKQLPDCTSPYVVKEIVKSYGGTYAFLSKFLPMDLVFQLRRAKAISQTAEPDVHYCYGEYSSVLGAGPLKYSVTWFDPENKSLDELKVTIYEVGMPEIFNQVTTHLN